MNKNLILAMGAEHTNPERLKAIINYINNDRDRLHVIYGNKNPMSMMTLGYIGDKYNITPVNDYREMRYVMEEKFDGYSYLNQDGEFYSKRLSAAKGNEGMPVCKSDSIHITPILRKVYEVCGANLHGELYIPGGISDDVTKILGCTPDLAMERTMATDPSKRLHYMLIDIREYQGHNLINEPYWVRRAILEHVYWNYIVEIQASFGHQYIVLPEILTGDPNEEFGRIIRRGGEGVIFKRTDALYIPGKKPANNWVKGKKKITYDVVMMGLNEGTGKNKDIFGSIKFGHYVDGKLVACGNCSSGLDDKTRQYIYDNADRMIASKQVFEIEAIQESVKSFRNAVFLRLRDDKDASECVPMNIRLKDTLI
jgi:hypothetical protein